MTDSGVTEAMRLAGLEATKRQNLVLDTVDCMRIYLAMRKLDPALAIPNDEGMREQFFKIGYHRGYDDAFMDRHRNDDQAWRDRQDDPAALAATPSSVEDDEMIERVVKAIWAVRQRPPNEVYALKMIIGHDMAVDIARAAIAATKGDA